MGHTVLVVIDLLNKFCLEGHCSIPVWPGCLSHDVTLYEEPFLIWMFLVKRLSKLSEADLVVVDFFEGLILPARLNYSLGFKTCWPANRVKYAKTVKTDLAIEEESYKLNNKYTSYIK